MANAMSGTGVASSRDLSVALPATSDPDNAGTGSGAEGTARTMTRTMARTMTLTSAYWPADTSLPVLETTVGGVLRDAAADTPEGLALVGRAPDPAARKRWTFHDLLTDAERAARALSARFRPGERVAVWAPNLPEWIILEHGAALAGLTPVTVNPAYRPAELRYVLDQP